MLGPEQNYAAEDATQDDDWLSDDIKNEIQKLEELSQQLDKVTEPAIKEEAEQPLQRPGKVVKPEASQDLEQLCWRLKAQQTESRRGKLEPERAEVTNNVIKTPPKKPKHATIETSEQKDPGSIPPKQPPSVQGKSVCNVQGCQHHFRGCKLLRDHSGTCEGVLDIGYLCIQPRVRMRAHKWAP